MYVAEYKWKHFNQSLLEEEKICGNCKYNFDPVCVEHSSPVGYGGKIDDSFTCELWHPSFEFFNARLNDLGK